MLMMKVESDRPSRAQGIQWGIALISIVASTGSPSIPRSSSVFECAHRVVVPHVLVDLKHNPGLLARLDQPPGLAVRHRQRLLGQDSREPARMREHPVDHARLLIRAARRCRRLRPQGRRAFPRPTRRQRGTSRTAATSRALSIDRDVIPTTRNPASAYATRWQSRTMKPAPTTPMPTSRLRGGNGRWLSVSAGSVFMDYQGWRQGVPCYPRETTAPVGTRILTGQRSHPLNVFPPGHPVQWAAGRKNLGANRERSRIGAGSCHFSGRRAHASPPDPPID